VNANHHQRVVRMSFLERSQHGEGVEAVDSAECPEVEDDAVSPELAQAQRRARPEPGEAFGKLGSTDSDAAHGG
jgi:hypothetical protein